MPMLKDGFKVLIDLTGAGTTFEEVSGKLPGLSIGEKIAQTTMRNTEWMTYAPQVLKDMTDSSLKIAYDSAFLDSIVDSIGENQLITFTLPDESTYAFWGFLASFEPDEFQKGTRPEATIVISPTNVNDSDVETAPVWTAAP